MRRGDTRVCNGFLPPRTRGGPGIKRYALWKLQFWVNCSFFQSLLTVGQLRCYTYYSASRLYRPQLCFCGLDHFFHRSSTGKWLAYMQSQPAMTLSRQCFPNTRRRHSIPSYSCEVSGPLWLRMLSLFFMLSRLVPASIVFLFSQKQVVVMTTTLTLSFLLCRNWTDWEYLQTIERICGQREQWTTTRSHTQNQQRDANAVARQRRYFLRYTCFYPCRFTTQPL